MKQSALFHLEKLGKDKLPAAAPIDYTRMISLASCFSLINPNPGLLGHGSGRGFTYMHLAFGIHINRQFKHHQTLADVHSR
jgi:hypothetical protein